MADILICGANGQLGQSFRKMEASYKQQLIYTDVEELDLLQADAIRDYLKAHPVDFVVNCAAYTQVDRAEEDADMASKLNRAIPRNLRMTLKDHPSAKLIHISTDYVYRDTGKVHKEDDPLGSDSVYGRSKLEGEQELSGFDRAMIIRTSWLHSEFGNNFVRTMVRLMSQGKDLRVVNDQKGNPTYAPDLAAAILQIITEVRSGSRTFSAGAFNYSNEGICSWFEFASAIREIGSFSSALEAVPGKEYPTPAPRPAFSPMEKTLIKDTYGLNIPEWESSLRKGMNEILK